MTKIGLTHYNTVFYNNGMDGQTKLSPGVASLLKTNLNMCWVGRIEWLRPVNIQGYAHFSTLLIKGIENQFYKIVIILWWIMRARPIYHLRSEMEKK